MPGRQFDVYVDGERLPHRMLRDEETQFGVESSFNFDDSVVRYDAPRDADHNPVDPRDEFEHPAGLTPFAHLEARALSFTLRWSLAEPRGDMLVRCTADLRLVTPETMHEFARFGPAGAPLILPWGVPMYVCGEGADDSRMLLEVRRAPLRELGAALNRR